MSKKSDEKKALKLYDAFDGMYPLFHSLSPV
jgi:hypothetical protein